MHLDIYRELQKEGVGFDPGAFDIWREEYNSQRPHASLGMQMPDEVYVKSSKPFDPSTKELDYGDLETRKVHPKNGTISYEKECYKISSALGGYTVGLKATGIHHTEVWFSHLLLGHIDHRVHTFTPISHDSLSKARTETTEV